MTELMMTRPGGNTELHSGARRLQMKIIASVSMNEKSENKNLTSHTKKETAKQTMITGRCGSLMVSV